jgi:hypothetical protein
MSSQIISLKVLQICGNTAEFGRSRYAALYRGALRIHLSLLFRFRCRRSVETLQFLWRLDARGDHIPQLIALACKDILAQLVVLQFVSCRLS